MHFTSNRACSPEVLLSEPLQSGTCYTCCADSSSWAIALQSWKDKDDREADQQAQEVDLAEDDDDFDQAAEQFEAQYNFRFEVSFCRPGNRPS